ncbi:YbhB/YbcL family Raf kinase inhibitor-like protein [Desulfovibrio inopinatus]|uniref:YbhB/YbcL family Raf kinase inhibitor-like protein n=1 Tax=Desulfovibrio inopinatus TaxID=102109 RepID=UPI000418DA5F|nr:YbhB/YbcL family Raf kinase inhibitor-like protein [Desulfovibrio inopinatus]
MNTLRVTSPAFTSEADIPRHYTCDDANIFPGLSWSGIPLETQSISLVCDDPDAPHGLFVHGIIWNLPPETTELDEGLEPEAVESLGGMFGVNSYGRREYVGPCPPSGSHRYYFKVYALDCLLSLPATAMAHELEQAMQGHVLARGELMGRYSRS